MYRELKVHMHMHNTCFSGFWNHILSDHWIELDCLPQWTCIIQFILIDSEIKHKNLVLNFNQLITNI